MEMLESKGRRREGGGEHHQIVVIGEGEGGGRSVDSGKTEEARVTHCHSQDDVLSAPSRGVFEEEEHRNGRCEVSLIPLRGVICV